MSRGADDFLDMPVEVSVAPPGIFAVRRRRGVVHSWQGVSTKYRAASGFAFFLLLFVGAGFVASDPGPRALDASRALSDVQEAHVGLYEAHLASMALHAVVCR